MEGGQMSENKSVEIHYCDGCAEVRNLPVTEKTKDSVQCHFCERNIVRCNTIDSNEFLNEQINTSLYTTSKESIQITQLPSILPNMPLAKIHPTEPHHLISENALVVYTATSKGGIPSIILVNRSSGEQVVVAFEK
jgi:hypothetical protein